MSLFCLGRTLQLNWALEFFGTTGMTRSIQHKAGAEYFPFPRHMQPVTVLQSDRTRCSSWFGHLLGPVESHKTGTPRRSRTEETGNHLVSMFYFYVFNPVGLHTTGLCFEATTGHSILVPFFFATRRHLLRQEQPAMAASMALALTRTIIALRTSI